jgi:hypothetical protein
VALVAAVTELQQPQAELHKAAAQTLEVVVVERLDQVTDLIQVWAQLLLQEVAVQELL